MFPFLFAYHDENFVLHNRPYPSHHLTMMPLNSKANKIQFKEAKSSPKNLRTFSLGDTKWEMKIKIKLN